jgi:hypothetical protein
MIVLSTVVANEYYMDKEDYMLIVSFTRNLITFAERGIAIVSYLRIPG